MRLLIFHILLFHSSVCIATDEFNFEDLYGDDLEIFMNVEKNLSLGLIVGKLVEFENVSAEIYNSVPYAKPPIGNLRFEKPERLEKWQTPLNTSRYVECWQNGAHDSEDCLYMKVVLPVDESGMQYQEKLPAIIWIPGNSYSSGSKESYSPLGIIRNFVSKKFIVIIPNYRLGVFGFLSTSKKDLPGNYGLEDLISALNFITENVDPFGIDVNRITLAGDGTGAALASILAVSPRTKGMIARVLLASGSSLLRSAIRQNHTIASSKEVIDKCKCNRASALETKVCMQQVPIDCIRQYYNQQENSSLFETVAMGSSFVTPVIDNFRESDSIIPEPMATVLKKKARVPILITSMKHEMFTHYSLIASLRSYYQRGLNKTQAENSFQWALNGMMIDPETAKTRVLKELRKEYSLVGETSQVAKNFCSLLSDATKVALHEEALMYAGNGQQVYLIENIVFNSEDDYSVKGVDISSLFMNRELNPNCQDSNRTECNSNVSDVWLTRYIDIVSEFIKSGAVTKLAPFTVSKRSATEISDNGTKTIDYYSKAHELWWYTLPELAMKPEEEKEVGGMWENIKNAIKTGAQRIWKNPSSRRKLKEIGKKALHKVKEQGKKIYQRIKERRNNKKPKVQGSRNNERRVQNNRIRGGSNARRSRTRHHIMT